MFTYKSKAEPSTGLTLEDGVRIINGYVGIVVRSDGKEVWRSNQYGRKATAVLQSNRALPGFRQYLKEHGRCWWDVQEAKRQKKREWDKARSALVEGLRNALSRGANARVTGEADCATAGAKHGYYVDSHDFTAFALGYRAAESLPPKPKG